MTVATQFNKPMDLQEINSLFPELKNTRLLLEIEKFAILKTLQPGDLVVGQGDEVAAIPLLIEGAIKVIRENDSDREILMYHIEPGESCVLSLSSLLSMRKSKITAVAELESKIIVLPANQVFRWMTEFEEWTKFIFGLFDKRLSEVMVLVEAVTFNKADERLWLHLKQKARMTLQGEIITTHQELALELGTVREVVSRLLKGLERNGFVKLGRGKITVLKEP